MEMSLLPSFVYNSCEEEVKVTTYNWLQHVLNHNNLLEAETGVNLFPCLFQDIAGYPLTNKLILSSSFKVV